MRYHGTWPTPKSPNVIQSCWAIAADSSFLPVRRRLDLQDGDRIILSIDDEGSLRLVSARQAARRTRGLLRRIAPALQDRRLAEELIAERRAEAARK
jgi:bifunctional DNA-binding transcriptional regulator/antitoxin component of YhaV-PrlF toxin-antitoxin module